MKKDRELVEFMTEFVALPFLRTCLQLSFGSGRAKLYFYFRNYVTKNNPSTEKSSSEKFEEVNIF